MEFLSILTVSQAHGRMARPLASRERADDHLGVLARLLTDRTGFNMDKASSEKVMAPSAEQFKAKYGEKICGKLQGSGDLGRS